MKESDDKNHIYKVRINIKCAEFPNHWFGGLYGEELNVKKFPYLATNKGTLNSCNCDECIARRGNEKLYDMFEVYDGKHKGNIIDARCLDFPSYL